MDQELLDYVRRQAKFCIERAGQYKAEAMAAKAVKNASKDTFTRMVQDSLYHRKLNDSFYWGGKATAYMGIAAGVGLREVVANELEEEGTCP